MDLVKFQNILSIILILTFISKKDDLFFEEIEKALFYCKYVINIIKLDKDFDNLMILLYELESYFIFRKKCLIYF